MSTTPVARQDPIWDHVGISAMPDRPPLTLPDGHRVAVNVVVNVEHYDYLPPSNRFKNPYPSVPAHPDIVGYSYREYGNRVGLWRMLDVFDEFEIPITCSLNVAAVELFPEVRDVVVDRGWSIMSHGEYNTRLLYGLSYEQEWDLHADVARRVTAIFGRPPRGLLGPSFTATESTYEIIAAQGMDYTMDWFVDDQPFPIRAGGRTLVGVPYSRELNDAFIMPGGAFYGFGGDYFARMCRDQFEVLAAEGEHSARVMTIALHPFYMGLPQEIESLRAIFAGIREQGGAWWTTPDRIVDWYRGEGFDRVDAQTTWPRGASDV